MELRGMTLGESLCRLSSRSAAPGGGAGAAVVGAIGAALLGMAAKLGAEAGGNASGPEGLCNELTRLAEMDSAAYAAVLAASRSGAGTEVERALERATEAPLRVAGSCIRLLQLAEGVIRGTRGAAVADAVVGLVAARAGLVGALVTASANVGRLASGPVREEMVKELEGLAREGAVLFDKGLRAAASRGFDVPVQSWLVRKG